MSLLEWGALGELVGGVAIIISLIYVGVQVKQNTDALRLRTVHDAAEDMADLYLKPAENGELADIFMRGLQDINGLSGLERVRLYGFFHKFFRTYENVLFQHEQGVLDLQTYQGITRQFMAIVSMPGGESYWGDRKSWFSDRFQAHIDTELAALEVKGFELERP
jgi:hypothetical protein